jgi:hypothetical protein
VRKRTVKGKNHLASGKQAAFERVAIGRVAIGAWALGALAVGAGAFGALAIGALAIRALAQEGQDRAPQHRGVRGGQAAREGVGRRAGTNSTARRIGVDIMNSVLTWST